VPLALLIATFIPSAGGPTAPHKEDNVLSTQIQAGAPAINGAVVMAGKREATSDLLLETVLASLNDNSAEDIVQIDLRGKTEIGDHMIICSGRSTRQVAAISEKLAQRVKDEFGHTVRTEGKGTGDWVLVDTGDVVVHVFRPEVREFYQLEKMWLPQADTAE